MERDEMTAKKDKERVILTSGRKKTAIARVRIMAGCGSTKINGIPLHNFLPASAAEIINEPLQLAKGVLGEGFASNLDISANMRGGGVMGQA